MQTCTNLQTLVETPKNLERIAVTWRNLQRHAENSRFTQKLVHIHKNFVETCCARSPDNLYNDIDVDPNDDLKKYLPPAVSLAFCSHKQGHNVALLVHGNIPEKK